MVVTTPPVAKLEEATAEASDEHPSSAPASQPPPLAGPLEEINPEQETKAKQETKAERPSDSSLSPRTCTRALLPARLEAGDLVSLGPEVHEHRGCAGVVTQVHEAHCTVKVLDGDRQVVVGECWPNFCDVRLVSSYFRLGTKVVVQGLTGAKTKEFNGAYGAIVAHPKQGHPCFVEKASAPGAPRLTFCVSVDSPNGVCHHQKQVLLEPRFLVESEEHFNQLAQGLVEHAAAALEPCSASPPATE